MFIGSPGATDPNDPRSVSFFPTSQCESKRVQVIDAYRVSGTTSTRNARLYMVTLW